MRNYIKKSMEHLILLNSTALDTTRFNTCMLGCFDYFTKSINCTGHIASLQVINQSG